MMTTTITTMLRCLFATEAAFIMTGMTTTTAQKYEINFDPLNPYIATGDGNSNRFLQTQPRCSVSGSRFICDIATEVRAMNDSITLAANLNCEFSSQAQVDYRRATGCTCSAQIISTADQEPRVCPCLLCPSGFGNNPVSVDCDYDSRPPDVDPFIIGTCSSFDCSFACNGTCSFLGCEEPIAPECRQLCLGSQGPTPAPSSVTTTVGNATSLPPRPQVSSPTDCMAVGSTVQCEISTEINSGDSDSVTLQSTISCPLENRIEFDAHPGCQCTARVFETSNADEFGKICPCSLCPKQQQDGSTQNTPISIDCDYEGRPDDVSPFIIGNCSSFDCNFICNGEIDDPKAQVTNVSETNKEPQVSLLFIGFNLTDMGIFRCTVPGSRCLYNQSQYGSVDTSTGQSIFVREGDVWASIEAESDKLTLMGCQDDFCHVICNSECTCSTKSGEECESFEATDENSTENGPVPDNQNDENIEAKCADGSDCARRCKGAINALQTCFENKSVFEPGNFEECVFCIREQDSLLLLDGKQIGEHMYAEKVCKNQPDCETACGVCFRETTKVVDCAWGCNFESKPCDACYFLGLDPPDCKVYGQLEGLLIAWNIASKECLDFYNIRMQSIDFMLLAQMFPNPDGLGGNINNLVNFLRFDESKLIRDIRLTLTSFFREDRTNDLALMKDYIELEDGSQLDCLASQDACWNALKDFFSSLPGASQMQQIGIRLYDKIKQDQELEQSIARTRICVEGGTSVCEALTLQIEAIKLETRAVCSSYGLGPGDIAIPCCSEEAECYYDEQAPSSSSPPISMQKSMPPSANMTLATGSSSLSSLAPSLEPTDLSNTSTTVPSPEPTQPSNMFDRPETNMTTLHIENIAVVLQGMTQILNETQQSSYMEACQQVLNKEDNIAVVVVFVSQQLFLGRRRLAQNRKQKTASLEVITQIGSQEILNPGENAIEIISENSTAFIEALTLQDQVTFAVVSNATADYTDDQQPPVTEPESFQMKTPTEQQTSKPTLKRTLEPTFKPTVQPTAEPTLAKSLDDRSFRKFIFIGIPILALALGAAIYLTAKLIKMLRIAKEPPLFENPSGDQLGHGESLFYNQQDSGDGEGGKVADVFHDER